MLVHRSRHSERSEESRRSPLRQSLATRKGFAAIVLPMGQGTTSVVPKQIQKLKGFSPRRRTPEQQHKTGFCIRARLQSCQNRSKNSRALAPEDFGRLRDPAFVSDPRAGFKRAARTGICIRARLQSCRNKSKNSRASAPEDFGRLRDPAFVSDPEQDSKGLHELAFVSGHDFSRAKTDPKIEGL